MMLKPLSLMSALILSLGWASPGLSQDAAAGEAVFKKCTACHEVGPDAENKTGPALTGVVGRAAGAGEGFDYRKDIVAAGEKGLVWDEATLVAYLADPTKFLRDYLDNPRARSGMSFRLKDEQDAKDVIAYIVSASGTDTTAAEPAEPAVAETPEMIEAVIAEQVFTEEYLADEANFEAGKEIWFAQCTHCHGFKAYPGKAPKLKPAKYTPEFVFKRVYKGFKKMPAWRDTYTVDEIRMIVAYVKNKSFSP